MDRDALQQGIEIAAQRARWTRGLLVAVVLASIASIVVDMSLLEFAARVQSGEAVTAAEGQVIDDRHFVLMWIWIGLSVLTPSIWLTWVHRATANLRLAGSGRSRFTPGWAVGWYFVPIMNLFKVWQVMHDLAGRSADGNDCPDGPRSDSRLVNAWWPMFVLSRFIDRYVGNAVSHADTINEIARTTRLAVFSGVLVAITAVLAWLVVRHIDRLQREVLVLAPPVPA